MPQVIANQKIPENIALENTEKPISKTKSLPHPNPLPTPESNFRRVFQTSDQMKNEFIKFLKTIFFQLDEKKVMALMSQLLDDPNKSDEQIYHELQRRMPELKKKMPILSRIKALLVLKKGMGNQAAQLTKNFNPQKFQNYMEIYDRRYLDVIRNKAKLPLKGKTIAVCDTARVNLADRIQAGAVLSKYPYKTHVSLNESDCTNALLEPEKTYRPIGNEVQNNSVDLIGCLGGLHHIPAHKVDPFVQSMHQKLRPGAVILLREHDISDNGPISKEDLTAITALVHTFVNASDGVHWEAEKKEIREFKSTEEWIQLMENHGFTYLSGKACVLKDDPTNNKMVAFVKQPQTLSELRQAIAYRKDCTRPKEGTRATWIEWGNVRYSKQYAHFIQDHHSYAFDFIGHMRQHWKHFYYFIKESLNDKEVPLRHTLFCDAMLLNVMILILTTVQCLLNSLTSLPSRLVARYKYGSQWRNVANLTEMEKFQAKCEKEYADNLDHTPFYMQSYIPKIKEMWKILWNSKEHWTVKLASSFTAISNTMGLFSKAVVAAPIRAIYTQEANKQPDEVKMLIKDPSNEINSVIERWEREKNPELDRNNGIEVIYTTPDGYKLISVPRYRPFTKIFGYFQDAPSLEILEVGNQKEISVDLHLSKESFNPVADGARKVYEMKRLQDPEESRYVTYQVQVEALKNFQNQVGLENIHYIHE